MILFIAIPIHALEIRGTVAGTVNGASNLDSPDNSFTWNPQNFAGFCYDTEKDIGTETLTFALSENNKLSGDTPYGVTYTTTAQNMAFERDLWGSYKVIGFQGEKYFAGYIENKDDATKNIFFNGSTDSYSLSSEQLQKILMDSREEMTITSVTPLKLKEGYELAIKSIDIDGNKVYLELYKDGTVVDREIVSSSKDNANELDKTYYYRKPQVGLQTNLITIGVHFKNALRGVDQNMATIDGVWQISDTPIELNVDTQYDKLTIYAIDANAGTIAMHNKDEAIALSRNTSISLFGDIKIKIADSDDLRFYIYKPLKTSGIHEIRSAVVNDENNLAEWNPQNFAGFYYDINKDLGAESLKVFFTRGNELSGYDPYGVTYTTTAQWRNFEFENWGYYSVIAFLTDEYFSGYTQIGTSFDILNESNGTNLLESGQLTKVLIDDDKEKVINLGTTVALAEGYTLKITLGTDKKGILVEVFHDRKAIDREALILPGSYVYTSNVGNTTKIIPVIAAHFQEPIIFDDKSYCKMDGLWQISQKPITVKPDTSYGVMTISTVDANAGTITMDNRDNDIILSKHMEAELMPGINIMRADNDTLRFYLYRTVEIAPIGVGK